MPAPSTVDEFLELARKSGTVDEPRLEAYVQNLRAAGSLPAEPSKLAALLVRDALLTYFQAEHLLQGKWKKFTIGKYKVLERLGVGGMGSVYLCEHKFMFRRVAVKVLPTAKADDEAALKRFYREARAVAALDHPNIVRAYDIDQDEKLHFLVMEYVDGASLQEIIKKAGPMDPIRAAHYIRQAAAGLQHALEAAALIHRDVKPGNILVDRTGGVKVLDMGLARFFNDEIDQITKQYDENVLGTADYLAPEQALDSHGVDIRADIYGLGATFYYCLTGRTPFEGTVAQKLIWHQTRQPKSINEYRQDVPEGLVAIVEKMMAKDPADRYQTPAEVVEALEPWTATPIPPPPEEEMPRLSPAAMGINPAEGGSSFANPVLPSSQPASPSSKARKVWQVSGSPSPKPTSGAPTKPSTSGAETAPAKRTPVPGTPKQRPAPVKPPPPPAPEENGLIASGRPAPKPAAPSPAERPRGEGAEAPAPAPAGEQVSWEDISIEAGSSIRGVNTSRSGKRAAVKRPPSRPVPTVKGLLERVPPGQRVWWAVAAGFLVLVVLALVLWLVVLRPGGRGAAPTAPRGPTTLYVGRASQPDAFETVRQAMGKARPGDRIVLLDDVEEAVPFTWNGVEGGKDITIEGAVKDKVTWRLAKGRDEERFVGLTDVSGLRLRGLTLDGQGRTKDLVVLSGHCPGLTLEDLVLRGFTQSAVRVLNCAGTAERPVLLTGLHFKTLKDTDAALLFDANRSFKDPAINQYIAVRDCRFEATAKNPVQATEAGIMPNVDFYPPHKPVVIKRESADKK
jgi:serine/threonine protein kinase